jgi:hypothetical protein
MAFRVAFRRLAAIAPAGRMVVKAAAAATVAGAGITVAFCGSSPAPAAGGKTLSTVPVVKDAAYYQAVCVVPTDRGDVRPPRAHPRCRVAGTTRWRTCWKTWTTTTAGEAHAPQCRWGVATMTLPCAHAQLRPRPDPSGVARGGDLRQDYQHGRLQRRHHAVRRRGGPRRQRGAEGGPRAAGESEGPLSRHHLQRPVEPGGRGGGAGDGGCMGRRCGGGLGALPHTKLARLLLGRRAHPPPPPPPPPPPTRVAP